MESKFGALHFSPLLFQMDDIIMFSSSATESLNKLEMLLTRLKHGLKIEIEKQPFLKLEVAYQGYVISSQGVATDPRKTEAVANWIPSHQSFLVFAMAPYCGFLQDWRHHYIVWSELTGTRFPQPTAKALTGYWMEDSHTAFEELRN